MALPQQAFTFRSPSSFSWLKRSNENDGLCDECVKLNLEESFANAFALYEGARRGRNTRRLEVYRSNAGPPYLGHFYYVTSMGKRLSSPSLCKLCSFLKQTCPNPNIGTYKLLAICTSESYHFEVPKKNTRGRPEKRPWGEVEHNVFMALAPEVPLIPKTGVPLRWMENELPKTGAIYRLSHRTPPERMRLALPRIVSPSADIQLAGSWLDCCRQAHRSCGPKKPNGASLPGFRVINCARSPLVIEDQPWSENYVALSYVWGPPSGQWTKTILDAVEVTKRMGEQYLWVDRLCINQSNLQEKQNLISRMDAIYDGAVFTIVAAAGDARTGLHGINAHRKAQPQVELECRTTNFILASSAAGSTLDPYPKFIGITKEEYEKNAEDSVWLDLHRFGLNSKVVFTSEDMEKFQEQEEIMETHGISREHLEVFQDMADDVGLSIAKWMPDMKLLAQAKGIPLQDLAPCMLREIATAAGVPADNAGSITSRPTQSASGSSKKERALPPGALAGRTTLVSTLEDPRITIRRSDWATRGWTYQEGVLSNRRLVFTEQQMYWECRGMAYNESLDLLDLYDPSETRFADFMLSGIFDGDLHRVPEMQYGFQTPDVVDVLQQVLKLSSHIRAFTRRNLSYDSDALNAFLGIAARYSTNKGLSLLLGLPVWTGSFATGKPGLQDTFALSTSSWIHIAPRTVKDLEMFVTDCRRRPQFPSWTWLGWKGRVDFSTTNADCIDEDVDAVDDDNCDLTYYEDSVLEDFFRVMTSETWAGSINRLWSADMILHASDGSEATLLEGEVPITGLATDQSKTWLLTIREPFVLCHMVFMHFKDDDQRRRLMGKRVQLHLSVPISEAELRTGHKNGKLATVLVFASTVPFVWNGVARFLVLRKVDDTGPRWERIGSLSITLGEWGLGKCKNEAEMIAALPVKKFGGDLVLT